MVHVKRILGKNKYLKINWIFLVYKLEKCYTNVQHYLSI